MSAEARLEAVPFEPGSGEIPPALEPALTDSDTPILLLVAPDTGGTALRAAIGLAEARAAAGHPTVLADAAVRDPRLHELLGTDNLEGLADVFLFGASLEHVRVRPEGRGFEFIPVGAYVPEPGAVLESPRWDTIGETVRSEGAGLLLFVSADTPGLGILSGRIGRAVVLGGEREANRVAARLAPSCRIVGVAESVGDPERPPAVDAAAEAEVASSEAAELSEPVVFRADRKSRRRVSPILLILLLAALIAAGWYAYQRYLATPAEEPAPQPGATQAEPVRPQPVRGDPVETPIPVSVAVEAHQDLAHARERVAALRDAESDIQFYLAPVSVRGSVYYRLLAGPVTDQTQGEALMDRLVEAGHKTSADVWSVLPTKLAFHLGEFETREAAERRVEMLATRGIPAYIVPVAYDPGSDQYRVYGGAFQSEHEAAVMGELLAEAGAQARLVERTGRPTPGAS